MAKDWWRWKQQPSIQQRLDKLFHSARVGGRGDESGELHGVGADDSSTSKTMNTNTSFAGPSTTKLTVAEMAGLKTCGKSH